MVPVTLQAHTSASVRAHPNTFRTLGCELLLGNDAPSPHSRPTQARLSRWSKKKPAYAQGAGVAVLWTSKLTGMLQCGRHLITPRGSTMPVYKCTPTTEAPCGQRGAEGSSGKTSSPVFWPWMTSTCMGQGTRQPQTQCTAVARRAAAPAPRGHKPECTCESCNGGLCHSADSPGMCPVTQSRLHQPSPPAHCLAPLPRSGRRMGGRVAGRGAVRRQPDLARTLNAAPFSSMCTGCVGRFPATRRPRSASTLILKRSYTVVMRLACLFISHSATASTL